VFILLAQRALLAVASISLDLTSIGSPSYHLAVVTWAYGTGSKH
jgi:hypothetical protein